MILTLLLLGLFET